MAGRAGIVVTAVARTAQVRGLAATTLASWGLVPRPERVSAVVDAELGILLRRELRYPDGKVAVTEFLGLEVGGAVDPSVFSAEAGSFSGDRSGSTDGSGRRPVEDVGLEALKMVAGLAAGGLGAAIKYTPKRQVDPFAAATAEDPDDVMPDDEPLPAGPPAGGRRAGDEAPDGAAGGTAESSSGAEGRTPVGDEVLNLLYRDGLEPARSAGGCANGPMARWWGAPCWARCRSLPGGRGSAGSGSWSTRC